MPEYEWEEWIKKRLEDPETKTVGIGIVTYNSDERLQKKYLMDIGIGFGFIKLKLGLDESTKILLTTLKASGGERAQEIRASLVPDRLACGSQYP